MNTPIVGVIGTSKKEDERRVPIHPEHLPRIPEVIRRQLIFEEGYGEPFGITDSEIAAQTGGIAPRHDLLAELGTVIIAKPVLSGLELVKLNTKKTAFIMVTSYSEFAIKSFELNVSDYLLKPISFERFAQSLLRFEEGFSKENNEIESFFIKEGDAYKKISIQDIMLLLV